MKGMPLGQALNLASALGITVDDLSQLDTPTSLKPPSVDKNTRFYNFIACTNDYRRITCTEQEKSTPDKDAERHRGPGLKLPHNTTIGDYYLKACFLRKYFTKDDVSIRLVINDFKEVLDELDRHDYDEYILEIKERLRRLKDAAADSTPTMVAPTALFSRILYSQALHGDIDKRESLQNLPQDLLDFALIFEVESREEILSATYANIIDAHTQGLLCFELPKNMPN